MYQHVRTWQEAVQNVSLYYIYCLSKYWYTCMYTNISYTCICINKKWMSDENNYFLRKSALPCLLFLPIFLLTKNVSTEWKKIWIVQMSLVTNIDSSKSHAVWFQRTLILPTEVYCLWKCMVTKISHSLLLIAERHCRYMVY